MKYSLVLFESLYFMKRSISFLMNKESVFQTIFVVSARMAGFVLAIKVTFCDKDVIKSLK